MKEIIKKSFVLMLALTVLLSAVPLSGFVGIEPTGLFSLRASAVEETEETISGTVGTKQSWSIDKASGVLTIDNTGDMISFASDDAPWKQYSGYITSAKINEGCTSISQNAFRECSKLKSVTLPDSLTSIGSFAFYYCASLVNITIPDSVTNIGEDAFYKCASLVNMTIPDSVRSIGNWAFGYCKKLESITIPSKVTSLEYDIFYNCISLTNIIIPDSVTSINSCAFEGCKSLTSVDIPYNCKSISSNAFANCTNLSKITIYSKDCSIDETAISIYSTIYGFSGSTAEAFANQYGYAFVSIDTPCEHEYSNACDDICNLCGEKRDTAHNFSDWETVKESSCTESGEAKRVCPVCGTEETKVIPIVEHSFGDWETVKESSCAESGEEKRTCSVCGTVETKKLDLLEHTDENGDGICEVCKKQFKIVYPMNGVCGENLTWKLDENGVLTIEGTGAMYNFADNWGNYRDYIKINNNPSSGNDDPIDPRVTTTATTKVYEPTTRSPEITTTTREYTTEFNTRTTQPDQEIITHPYGIYTTAYELTVTRPDTTKRQEITTVPSTTSPSTTVPSTTAPASSARVARMAAASYETTTNPYGPEDGYTKIFRWNLHFDEIKEVVIGEGVTSIGTYAFYNCKNLESVTIPKSVTGINRYAFSGCSSMTMVNFNAENCSINSNSFNNCAIITLNIGANVNVLPDINTLETATFAEGATKIPDYAFSGCSNLKSVTIPNTVTNIGRKAFYNCSSLESITIPDNTTNIGEYAFYGCTGVESVTIPEKVSYIGNRAFSGCSSLTTVYFNAEKCDFYNYREVLYNCPVKTLNIGANVNNLPGIITLETVTFADGTTKIPDYAFSGCSNLKSVTIPNTVTNIGREAFCNCSSLESITIPKKVTYIGSEAFYYCSNLETVNFNAESCGQIGYSAFSYCPVKVLNIGANVNRLPDINTLETVTFANGATKIPDYAFSGCTNLKFVTIPDSVTSIGDGAFQNCSNLENIEIPDGVKIIGNRVFNYCSKLKIIKLPDRLEKIGDYAFFACKQLNSVDLPSTLISIGYSAFDNCYGITEIDLPNGIESIGDFAFYACTSLSSVTIPESVKSLGYASFGACYSLSSVKLNAVECFAKSGTPFYCSENISSVTFGSGIKRIPEAFLLGKTGVSSADIPDSVIEIGDYAFSGTSITRVDLPEGVEVIGRSAFSNLYEAKELSIPKSVVSIGKNAFANTVSLNKIKFNAVSAELSNRYYGDVFANSGICSDGIEVIFGDNVEKVPAYLFEVGSETAYPNITSVVIGSKVKAIGDYAFYHCASIASVKFGESPETIGAHSFDGCFEIKSIQLPQSLKTIGEYAFYDCRGLTTLTIPEAVKYIGLNAFGNCCLINTINYNAANCEIDRIGLSYAFTDCENVMFINIGESVNSLPAYAFSGCENLERINIPDIVININPLAFYGCKDAAIVCASGSYGNAFAVQNGMKYVLSDNISGTAFEIKNGMLLEYNGIAENVVLPSEITSIGIDAFKGNSVIKSVEIPYNISKIYSGAFANCPNLERVIIPFTVTDISSSAFTGTNAEIYCYSNSYAYNYAVANNIRYELITVTLSQSNLYIVEGESIKVNAIPSVTLASGLPIVWKSSNTSVASVDSQGNIVGVRTGSTSIGAYSISGTLLDECTVSVEEPTEIEFKQASTNSLKYGEKLILHINASNMPDGASIKWSSSNDKIVKLSGENNECGIHDGCITCTVESVGTGKAEIKATVVDSDGNTIIQNGNEVSASFEMNSKAGLWQKIVAIFKKLFRISRTIIQSI